MPGKEQGPNTATRTQKQQQPSPSERIEAAQALAQEQEVSLDAAGQRSVLDHLDAQEEVLTRAYRYFVERSETDISISYAGEWMLDNFYVVQQTLRQVRKDLPDRYYRELPVLVDTDAAGYPRVYALAREIGRSSPNGIDTERLRAFVHTYQSVRSLTMGELWALPTMLRIIELEYVTSALLKITGLSPKEDEGALFALSPLAQDASDEQVVANGVRSLHMLLNQDWEALFEELSQVEQTLRRDPAGIYPHMDFDTRDRYRKRVETLAKETDKEELEIAQDAVGAARENRSLSVEDGELSTAVERTTHVGHVLVGDGRDELEDQLGHRPPWAVRVRRWLAARAIALYIGVVSASTLVIVALLLLYGYLSGGPAWVLALVGVVSLIPASAVAINVINWLLTRFVPPDTLPKMDFSEGVPEEYTTMVVIPALLSSESDISSLLQQIELHYLSNDDPNLHFALLTDLADAPAQDMPDDDALLERASAGIRQLNRAHPREGADPFHLYHRRRKWNPAEDTWMGWERKRGKLSEFNQLLLGKDDTSYMLKLGDQHVLSRVRYVITLDADTSLPRDSARRLAGTMAHPLNWATFDPESGRVVSGYTVLQPRTEIKPTSANQSFFSRVYAGDVHLDLYSRAVSDVYQDVFREGIYVGKGIYDVAAFEKSLDGRVPENALLSHDLFEGVHGRAALATDIILYEDYPPHYLAYAHRMHRWIRGDWQLLPWLLPRVPHRTEKRARNVLSVLDRWKITDNLRRSLTLPSVLAFLICGWLIFPGAAWLWTLLAATIVGVPLIMLGISALIEGAGKGGGIRENIKGLGDDALRWLLALAFMPYQVLITIDAIGSTLARLLVTRRRLLQWTTAAHTVRLFGREMQVGVMWLRMGGAPLTALVLGILVGLFAPRSLAPAIPLLVAWLLSPQVAHWISRPIERAQEHLPPEAHRRLHHLARRTWLYFERFVGPEDHWLPPDHYQEEPLGVVAHRTSPTNIGLLLLSTVNAYDLGYIGQVELTIRLRDTLDTLTELETYRGHLMNWYDTRTLEPLRPQYVSTVDSGNLAGCLLALAQACENMPSALLLRWEAWEGFLDACALLMQAVGDVGSGELRAAAEPMAETLDGFERQLVDHRDDPAAWPGLLREFAGTGWQTFNGHMMDYVEAHANELSSSTLREMRVWTERMQYHLTWLQREIDQLLPWWNALQEPPAFLAHAQEEGDIGEAWQALLGIVSEIPSLDGVPQLCRVARLRLGELQTILGEITASADSQGKVGEAREWCQHLRDQLDRAQVDAAGLSVAFEEIARHADGLFREMEFGFLLDPQREVFRIGYSVMAEALDNSYYDLLASEARVASLLAICKGDVPQRHWLHMARPLAEIEGMRALLSWSGTMFEYLMPTLLVESYPGTLLEQSCRAAVDRQIAYGRREGVPWGVSESSYYQFDANRGYQYKAFGVPGLGLKRGLADDLVITPYASMLALAIRPEAVMDNLDRLEELQAVGQYGLYESIDYTASRLPLGQRRALVRTYMAHHQAMIMLSLGNALMGDVMRRRFHSDQRVRSVELLLHERVPQSAPLEELGEKEVSAVRRAEPEVAITPWEASPDAPLPMLRVLSNGSYTVIATAAGGGWSEYMPSSDEGGGTGVKAALTRWRADTTCDNWGMWIYLHDLESGNLWSPTGQPMRPAGGERDVSFAPHQVAYGLRLDEWTVRAEVTVPPEDDVEVRRLTIVNHADRVRRLRVTSYGEVVLSTQETDRRHPAFNKLFIESEFLEEEQTQLYRRRRRAEGETPLYLGHTIAVRGAQASAVEYEGDRAAFVGRGETMAAPSQLSSHDSLAGHSGATLDPILSLSQEIALDPRSTAHVALTVAAGTSRAAVTKLTSQYRQWDAIDRAFAEAKSQSAYALSELELTGEDLQRVDRLLAALIYPHRGLRPEASILARNQRGQPTLWAQGISGDYPILLVRVHDEDEIELVGDVLKAHAYWHERRIEVDLVVLNEKETGYGQELNAQLHRLIERVDADGLLNQRGGIFVLRADQLGDEDRTLLLSAARVVLDGAKGSLTDQLAALEDRPVRLPALQPTYPGVREAEPTPALEASRNLRFGNGYGGFSPDGREYVIDLVPGQWTPAPWINVIANPGFGFLVSEAGLGCTWAGNSQENRLTPWRNDPVSDEPAEAIYLRDEQTGAVWSPTPLPARVRAPYEIRHGAGYSTFEHNSHGLRQRVRVFAVRDDPVKVIQLRLENTWSQGRRVTATYYAEWVLGTFRDATQQFVIPQFDGESEVLLARNPYNSEFSEGVAFAAAGQRLHGMTGDRSEFLGKLGSMRSPAALERIGLEGRVEPGLDPCAALQVHLDLGPGETAEIHFLLGQGTGREHALALAQRYREPVAVEAAWGEMRQYWDQLLETVVVDTPDDAMNLVLNRWLLYQALACRVWGRSALYQSSGAYGFRDQLQDVMALVHAAPALVREQILRSAEHQFEAGDVLHWWHPPSGRGVRTRISDDLLWLPLVTAHYVQSTGDHSILDEELPFLQAEPLKPGEEDRYGQYSTTETSYPLYEHCLRALDKGTTSGEHSLPLMGSGDWNDGMNRVGIDGEGESVWLGWFLYMNLTQFAALCAERGDDEHAAEYRARAGELQQALDDEAWDGAWYRRAYYDDGAPLGSARNRECRIDSIAQSWSVLSEGASADRAHRAMESVYEWLVKTDDRLILLFAPPFDKTPRDPGYIKGYPPGIRENGGQYTHAALWAVWAYEPGAA
jgi:cyclic beta-1,2-glucan synthetase